MILKKIKTTIIIKEIKKKNLIVFIPKGEEEAKTPKLPLVEKDTSKKSKKIKKKNKKAKVYKD